MRTLICVLICLLLFAAPTFAQAEGETPIYFLQDGGIYAVYPSDGAVETWVEPASNHAAVFEEVFQQSLLFSAEWLSPDGAYLAYTTFARDEADPEAIDTSALSAELYVLDLSTGESLPVTLTDDTLTSIPSLAWSPDGASLYVIGTQGAADTLFIVEREAWDAEPTSTELPAVGYAMARRVFAADQGIVIEDRGLQSPSYTFFYYDQAGSQVNEYTVDWNVSPDVNLYINTPFTPLLVDDSLRYGLVSMMDELIFTVDLASGAVEPMPDYGYIPALISGLEPDASLRVSTSMYTGDYTALILRDLDNNIVGSVDYVPGYAFGIPGDSVGSTFALSPDGQRLAYLQDGTINVWQDGESMPLGVSAQVIAWSPLVYTTVHDPAFFAG